MKAASAVAVTGSIAALTYYRLSFEDVNSASTSEIDTEFSKYMAEWGKSYATTAEYEFRRSIFEENFMTIVEHNS